MKRKEFLETLGLGAAFALTATCLGRCSSDTAPVSKEIDFEIDLTDTKYSALTLPGGYIIENEIVIARNLQGDYVAATVLCSHEPNKNITYKIKDTEGIWFCTVHGAEYTEDGTGLNAFGSNNLKVYNTDLQNNKLRVFSN